MLKPLKFELVFRIGKDVGRVQNYSLLT